MIHARRRSRVRSMRSGRGCETGPGDDPRASLSSASCIRKWTVSAASGHPEIGATKPCKMGAAARLRRGGLHRTVLDAPARPGAAANGFKLLIWGLWPAIAQEGGWPGPQGLAASRPGPGTRGISHDRARATDWRHLARGGHVAVSRPRPPGRPPGDHHPTIAGIPSWAMGDRIHVRPESGQPGSCAMTCRFWVSVRAAKVLSGLYSDPGRDESDRQPRRSEDV
jgi:hypothetical protein